MDVLIGVLPSAGDGAAVGTVIVSEGTSTCIDVIFVAQWSTLVLGVMLSAGRQTLHSTTLNMSSRNREPTHHPKNSSMPFKISNTMRSWF